MIEFYELYSCKICKVTSKKTHPKDNICSDCAKLFGGKQFTLESYGCEKGEGKREIGQTLNRQSLSDNSSSPSQELKEENDGGERK